MPYPSLAIRGLLGDILRGLRNRSNNVGVAGAAADVAGDAVADLALRACSLAQDQVARGDQHRRRAKAALQSVMLMEIPPQCRQDRIAGKAFDGLHGAVVAGDREHQARARRLAVDEDRAGAAHAVLAAEMGPGQIASLAQKIGQRQTRRNVVGDCGPVHRESNRGHAVTCCTARITATVWRARWNSSKYRSDARSRSAAMARCNASRS